jgi:hypothetical protein
MATYVKHNQFVEDLAFGVHNFTNVASAALTYWLTDDAPNVSTWVDIGDVTNSVTANIDDLTSAEFTTTEGSDGSYLLLLPDHVMTASGAVADFRYIGIYNDSAAADQIINHWDYGSTITGMAAPDTFTVDYTTSTFTLE